jgi:hypothetical protein
MLRLTFLSDVGYLAPGSDEVAMLRDLPEAAASEVNDVNFEALMKWVVKKGWEAAREAFPHSRYEELSKRLSRNSDAPGPSQGRAGSKKRYIRSKNSIKQSPHRRKRSA